MKIKTYNKFIFLFLFSFQNTFSQEIKNTSNSELFVGHVYSRSSILPIANATIKTYSNNELRYFISDAGGKFEIQNSYKSSINYIEVSSLGFKKDVKKIVLDTIYLDNETNQLDEVIVNSKFKITNQLSFFEKLNSFETNFSWNNKAAVYIPKGSENKNIEKLLFSVSDCGGVKNLKYLPFKINLYTVDSLGMPNKPILEEDIVVKKGDTEYWTKIDISQYKITIPAKGIFVVFVILDEKDYTTNFINSNFGWISAVPALKAYRHNKTYVRKSYLYRQCTDPEKCNIWLLQNLHYIIDVEF